MRYRLPLSLILLVVICCCSCTKRDIATPEEDDEKPVCITDSTLVGTWELRSFDAGWCSEQQYTSGNGNSVRFTLNGYETLTPDGTIKKGSYRLIRTNPNDYAQIQFDTLANFLRPPVYSLNDLPAGMPLYITVSKGQLRFVFGDGLAADGVETVYEKN